MSSIKTINPNPSPILKIEFGLYWLGGPIATLFKPVFTDKKFQATN